MENVVFLASLCSELQLSLKQFATECEAAGMRISTSTSEAIHGPQPEKGGLVEEFNYLIIKYLQSLIHELGMARDGD